MDEPARWKRGVFQVFLASLAAIAVYSTFPSPLGSRGLAIRRVTPAATVGPLPIAFLTTKAPYAPDLPGMYTKTFNGTLVHVNYLSRHGTRHANKLDTTLALISALASAGAWHVCVPWTQVVVCIHLRRISLQASEAS